MKKTATVFSNDPQRPRMMLTIDGPVDAFADIQPERIVLQGYGGETIRRELVVSPRAAYPFTITDITAKYGDNITYEWHARETPQGRTYTVVVENTKKTPGKYYDTLILMTDSTLKPKIPVHVYGTIGVDPKKGTPPS